MSDVRVACNFRAKYTYACIHTTTRHVLSFSPSPSLSLSFVRVHASLSPLVLVSSPSSIVVGEVFSSVRRPSTRRNNPVRSTRKEREGQGRCTVRVHQGSEGEKERSLQQRTRQSSVLYSPKGALAREGERKRSIRGAEVDEGFSRRGWVTERKSGKGREQVNGAGERG